MASWLSGAFRRRILVRSGPPGGLGAGARCPVRLHDRHTGPWRRRWPRKHQGPAELRIASGDNFPARCYSSSHDDSPPQSEGHIVVSSLPPRRPTSQRYFAMPSLAVSIFGPHLSPPALFQRRRREYNAPLRPCWFAHSPFSGPWGVVGVLISNTGGPAKPSVPTTTHHRKRKEVLNFFFGFYSLICLSRLYLVTGGGWWAWVPCF